MYFSIQGFLSTYCIPSFGLSKDIIIIRIPTENLFNFWWRLQMKHKDEGRPLRRVLSTCK